MKKAAGFFVLGAAWALAGCADASRNLYEGLRQHRQIDPNATQPATPVPDYGQYRREREVWQGQATPAP